LAFENKQQNQQQQIPERKIVLVLKEKRKGEGGAHMKSDFSPTTHRTGTGISGSLWRYSVTAAPLNEVDS